jgi:hypothetical protein
MQTQSFLIVSLMIYGITQHRYRLKHVKIMSIAMIWDVLLILQIELSRSAILKATQAVTNPMLLNIHVSIAVSTVILYGFMIWTGRKVLSGDKIILKRHKLLGKITMAMRVLTLVTSFLAVAEKF